MRLTSGKVSRKKTMLRINVHDASDQANVQSVIGRLARFSISISQVVFASHLCFLKNVNIGNSNLTGRLVFLLATLITQCHAYGPKRMCLYRSPGKANARRRTAGNRVIIELERHWMERDLLGFL